MWFGGIRFSQVGKTPKTLDFQCTWPSLRDDTGSLLDDATCGPYGREEFDVLAEETFPRGCGSGEPTDNTAKRFRTRTDRR